MPYQNNNNRITPEASGVNHITPEAQVLNKEVKYRYDDSQAQATLSLTQGLAELGKGAATIVDVAQKRQAEDKAIEMFYNDKKFNEGKHDYAEAMKRDTTGVLAQFNPYLKENYQKLAADDYFQQYVADLTKDPNYAAMSPEEMDQKLKQSLEGFRQTLRESNIETRFAAPYLEKFNTQVNDYKRNYMLKHNERQNELSYGMISRKRSEQLTGKLSDTPLDLQGEVITSEFQNIYEEHKDEMPIEDMVTKVIFPTLSNVMKNYKGTIDIEEVITAIKNTKLGDYYIGDIIVDVENRVRTSFNDIENQKYQDEQKERQRSEQETKKKDTLALKEINKRLMEDPELNPAEVVKEVVVKYGLEENYDTYLGRAARAMEVYENINEEEIIEDTSFVKLLDLDYIAGNLDKETVLEAYKDNRLKRNTFLAYLNGITAQEEEKANKKQKATEKAYKGQLASLTLDLKTHKVLYTTLKHEDGTTYFDAYTEAVNDIHALVLDETLTYEEGTKRLQELKVFMDKAIKKEQTKKAETQAVQTASYHSSQTLSKQFLNNLPPLEQNSKYDDTTTEQAIRDLSIIPYGTNIRISSSVGERTINGKKSYHNAYDIAIPERTKVYAPKGGNYIVEEVGYEHKSLGTYIVIRDEKTGLIFRYLHLYSTGYKKGMKINGGQLVGLSGNTGHSTGPHLHIDILDITTPNKKGYVLLEDAATRLKGYKYNTKKKSKR